MLPSAPNGYEFSWASESEYAVVSEDGTKIIVTRPASGEETNRNRNNFVC